MISQAYIATTKLYSVEQIKAFDDQGRLDFNLDCQRGHVWTDSQKQGMIDTLMFQERIPEVHAIKNPGSPVFSIADGKQRLSTVLDFINNRLPWRKSYADPVFENLFKKQKLWFDDLPGDYRDAVNFLEIAMATYEIKDESGIIKLFKKLNSGSPLNSFQKGIASNILLRKNFSNKLLAHPMVEKMFSSFMIQKDRVEDIFISILAGMLSVDKNGGRLVPISLKADDLFNYNISPLKDSLSMTKEERDEWNQTLYDRGRFIERSIDTLSQRKFTNKIRSKSQLLFPVLYQYAYNLSDDKFLKLFDRVFDITPTDVIGAGSDYSQTAVKKWINKIDPILSMI